MTPQDMSRLRWQHIPPAERTAFAKRLNRRRNVLLSAREKKAIACKGGEANARRIELLNLLNETERTS